ncbi:MAG: hypothetical protein WAO61_08085 [Solirubrobacterales bacterium]
MTDTDAAATLREIERVKRSTHALLDATWFPLLLWGSIVAASAPFTQLGDDNAVGFYWFLAGPAGTAASFLFFRDRELDLGLVDRHKVVYIALAAAIAIGSMSLGIAGDGAMLSAVGPVYVVAAGLAGFSWLERSSLLAVTALAMAAAGTGVLAIDPGERNLLAALVEGAVLIVAGVVALRRRKLDPARQA